nr:probable E3 ubiquitin-protein ligase XERICO [Ipomoea batatas]
MLSIFCLPFADPLYPACSQVFAQRNLHTQLYKPQDSMVSLTRLKSIMGLSTYPTPTDAGVLCVILVNTAISISIVKEIVRSILHVIGIRIAFWEEYNVEGPLDAFECRGAPSESYMEEFRSRTPAVPYDSVCCISKHLEQECPVCLAEFAPDAMVNQLSCGHVFHAMCLEKWLKYWNVTCPLCRNYIMPLDDDGDTAPM